MSLPLYRRHTSRCSRHERSFESDELRRGFKKCQCPIQFEGKIKGAGFVRKSTEKTTWEEAKVFAASWEASGTQAVPLPEPPPLSEFAAAITKKDEPVTIDRAAAEFMADIEARQMDESTRRKYRTTSLRGPVRVPLSQPVHRRRTHEVPRRLEGWASFRGKETGARPRGVPLRPGTRMDSEESRCQAEASDRVQQTGQQASLI